MGCIGVLLILTGLFVLAFMNWIVGLVLLALGALIMSSTSRGERMEQTNQQMLAELQQLRREREARK